MLAEAGETAEDPIPLAIETPRGLLVAALRATGRKVYSINPMAVARYRERYSPSGKKSDHADARSLIRVNPASSGRGLLPAPYGCIHAKPRRPVFVLASRGFP